MKAAVAGLVQLAGIALAPLVPGTVQSLKARAQGRRGTSPLQPYRMLRRLWGKRTVAPTGAGAVYRYAPPVAAAALLLVLFVVPVAGHAPDWPFGTDAVLLIGLLTLARLAVTLAAWDPGNGFALMGAARDLALTVFAEALLLLVLLLAALPAESTDLRAMGDAAGGTAPWSEPAHWCALAAFALFALVETGRQPIDNPDTHLELTMIHEGPLLEYAGRDLALLHWVAAARHWLIVLLAADLFLPHPDAFVARVLLLPVAAAVICVALAAVETGNAKMRVLRVPGLLAAGGATALAGVAAWLTGGAA